VATPSALSASCLLASPSSDRSLAASLCASRLLARADNTSCFIFCSRPQRDGFFHQHTRDERGRLNVGSARATRLKCCVRCESDA
jgi:hypothetical protein